ncbi:alpha-galactosidase, partial [Turicibacter sanguinis]|nr:alpha-galactosidase [Turicibacter sanguinis]
MAILFNEVTKEFHLYNDHVSYIITILQNNQLGQLYYGKRIRHNDSFAHLLETSKRAMAACVYEGNPFFTLEHFKLEYPTYGTGDFKYPAYEIMQENGSHVTNFEYVSHKIYRGKPALIDCLPATYVEDEDEAKTLEITLKDEVINTELVLTYTIYETRPVITRNARFNHLGEEKITLTNAMSACVDLPDSNYEMIELTGSWSRERHVKSRRLEHGIQAIYSMRGTSSHQYNPFLALKRPNADEFSGEVYGFSFVYSGNFLAQAEVDTYGVTRITMGLHPNRFNWVLNQGEVFQTPEVVMVYSQDGLNGMSQTYHELYRTRLARGYWRDRVRPVLINNWEATYFDFNEDKILNIAKTAKDLGVELFVLDDGWFGNREDDHRGLGDWYVKNHEKLPNGIEGLAQKVVDLGIKFGLWFEPEMVNKDSDLY